MNRTTLSRFVVLCFALLCMGEVTPALAEDSDPSSRVARLSYLQGEVSMQPVDTDSWVETQLNRPLTTDDKLWTARNARAELQLGSATLQLDEATGISFLELSEDVAQIRISEGVVNVRVKRLRDDETIELDTPNAAVSLRAPGIYRLEVNESGDATVLQVRSGRAEVTGDRQSFTLDSKEAAEFRGADRLTAKFFGVSPPDDFDAWAAERNDRADRAASTRFVSTDMVGYEDLDVYGDWRYDADYGYVWYPARVSTGWAPYRYGHWAWVGPWGWTWIDEAPWGFAPFHYGRWAYRSSRWCWVPGPISVRPVYAPALVAWLGRPGASVTVSIGGGSVGWFPLGPREVYVPAYRSSRTYVQKINISNTSVNNTHVNEAYDRRNVNIYYMNRTAPRALSVVEQDTFIHGRSVANHMARVNERSLRELPAGPTSPEIKPTRESALGAGRVRAAPPINLNRPVVASREPVRNSEQVGEHSPIKVTRPGSGAGRTRSGTESHAANDASERLALGPSLNERNGNPEAQNARPGTRRSATEEDDRRSRFNRGTGSGNTPNRKSEQRDTARTDRSPPASFPQLRSEAPAAASNGNAATETEQRALRQREMRGPEERSAASPWIREESRLPRERRNAIQSPPKSAVAVPAPQRAETPKRELRSAPTPQADAQQTEQTRRPRGKEYNNR